LLWELKIEKEGGIAKIRLLYTSMELNLGNRAASLLCHAKGDTEELFGCGHFLPKLAMEDCGINRIFYILLAIACYHLFTF